MLDLRNIFKGVSFFHFQQYLEYRQLEENFSTIVNHYHFCEKNIPNCKEQLDKYTDTSIDIYTNPFWKILQNCIHEKDRLKHKMEQTKEMMKQTRSLLQMDELKCHKRVLRRLGYCLSFQINIMSTHMAAVTFVHSIGDFRPNKFSSLLE
ncbi:hypothetical protein HUG17_4964 [Dermatophagoides farinae]|uniref:Uncharacterized protein n=1 Tax=Dermatophagoides farinae TaxID=6954 RepID=A0A9D4SGV1_DERFA|nr:hypothetical protein HUG17_4964 [Dermatophagoides farinae]